MAKRNKTQYSDKFRNRLIEIQDMGFDITGKVNCLRKEFPEYPGIKKQTIFDQEHKLRKKGLLPKVEEGYKKPVVRTPGTNAPSEMPLLSVQINERIAELKEEGIRYSAAQDILQEEFPGKELPPKATIKKKLRATYKRSPLVKVSLLVQKNGSKHPTEVSAHLPPSRVTKLINQILMGEEA